MTEVNLIPEKIMRALVRHTVLGEATGSFVFAVLRNDLKDTFRMGSEEALEALPQILAWLYWHAPSESYGSAQAVAEWRLKMKETAPVEFDRHCDLHDGLRAFAAAGCGMAHEALEWILGVGIKEV
jgi:hypothetical protein